MTEQKILTKQIKDYLLENPQVIDRTKPAPYIKLAEKFGVHSEVIRMIWKALRKKGLVEQDFHPIKTVITQKDVEDTFYSEFGDNAELRKSVKFKSLLI